MKTEKLGGVAGGEGECGDDVTRASRFHCLIGVINKPKTVDLCISPVYRRLAVAKKFFFKSRMQKLLT